MAARVVAIAKTLRNNWKKSTFAALLAGWGVYFVQDRIRANILREEFCRQAIVYGRQSITNATDKPRTITVILNPAARKGKGKKLFDKNAAPILHLAGIDVHIIKTESEGNGKEKASFLENTDAVVVAGGDGTIGEVITGLLRRQDEASVSRQWPVGIIPVGTTNSLAKILYADAQSDVRWMGNAALAIIRGVTEPIDVISIQGQDGRQIFTVNNLEWGKLQEARELASKYWYFGPLKSRLTYVFATLKHIWPPVVQANVEHRPPIAEAAVTSDQLGNNQCWLAWLLSPLSWGSNPASKVKELKKDPCVDDDPILWTSRDVQPMELVLATGNIDQVEQSPRALRLKTGPADVTRKTFIQEGWKRLKAQDCQDSDDYKMTIVDVGEVRITPIVKEGEEAWYNVDNEKLEAQPITVRLLPRKLLFFTDRQERDSSIG